MFILKLGGSAITSKNSFETLQFERLHMLCCKLKLTWKQSIVIVHGAGSFGHFQAKEYGVKNGYGNDENRTRKGFCLTRLSVSKLNAIVVQSLVGNGIPAVSVSPLSEWRTHGGEVIRDGCQSIQDLLQAGFVPVLHGDAVMDSDKGTDILSGDTIIKVICQKLKPNAVIFLSDVDGIYDKPPQEYGARLLSEVCVGKAGNVSFKFFQDSSPTSESNSESKTKLNENETENPTVEIESETSINVSQTDCGTAYVGNDRGMKTNAVDYDCTTTSVCRTSAEEYQTTPVSIMTSQQEHDVTGGIRLKLECGLSIVGESLGAIRVLVCNINSSSLCDLLAKPWDVDDSVRATRILYDSS